MKWEPVEVSDAELAFGPRDLSKMMPAYKEIPDEFRLAWPGHGNKWQEIFSKWFYGGLPHGTEFVAKEGIDGAKALSHIAAVMRSYEPKHEHKAAAVAFLMNEWFTEMKIPSQVPA